MKTHPLPEGVTLPEADFWTDAQREFLNACWQQDSDWVVPIDKSDALLRHLSNASRSSSMSGF